MKCIKEIPMYIKNAIYLIHVRKTEATVIYLYFGFSFFFRAETTVGAQIWIIMNVVKCRIHILQKKSHKIHSRIKHKTSVNIKQCCPYLRVSYLDRRNTCFNIKYDFATAWNQKACKINLSALSFKHRLLLFCSILVLMEWKSQESSTFEIALRKMLLTHGSYCFPPEGKMRKHL